MEERRFHPRLALPLQAIIIAAGKEHRATVENLSAGGAAATVPTEIPAGTRVESFGFALPAGEGVEGSEISTAAEIMHSERVEQPNGDGGYWLGIRFVDLPEAAFRRIQQHIYQNLTKGRPQFSEMPIDRRRVHVEGQVAIHYDRFDTFVDEISANISLGGMFIRTNAPKPPGSIFSFSFQLGGDFSLVEGRAEVVWTREKSHGSDHPAGMGVRFLNLDDRSRNTILSLLKQADPGKAVQRPPAGHVQVAVDRSEGKDPSSPGRERSSSAAVAVEELESTAGSASESRKEIDELRREMTQRSHAYESRVADYEKRISELAAQATVEAGRPRVEDESRRKIAGLENRLLVVERALRHAEKDRDEAMARLRQTLGERGPVATDPTLEAPRPAGAERQGLEDQLDEASHRLAVLADRLAVAERDRDQALQKLRETPSGDSALQAANRIEDLERALEEASVRRQELERELERVENDAVKIEREREELEGGLRADAEKARMAAAESRESLDRVRAMVSALESDLDKNREEGERKRERLVALERTLVEERESSSRAVAELEDRVADLESAREQVSALEGKLEESELDRATLEEELERERGEKTGLSEDLERVRGVAAALDADLEKARHDLAERRDRIAVVEEVLEKEQESSSALRAALDERTGDLDAARGRIAGLEEEIEKSVEERDSLHDEIVALQAAVRGLNREVESLGGEPLAQVVPIERPEKARERSPRGRWMRAAGLVVVGLALGGILAGPGSRFFERSGAASPIDEEQPVESVTFARTESTGDRVDGPSVAPSAKKVDDAESSEPVGLAGKGGGALPSEPVADYPAAAGVVEAWASAWAEQRVDDYLWFYSTEFSPPGGASRSAWEAYRRERVAAPESIEISLENLREEPVDEEHTRVVFEQAYRAGAYSDRVLKTLEMVREEGTWKIRNEQSEPLG